MRADLVERAHGIFNELRSPTKKSEDSESSGTVSNNEEAMEVPETIFNFKDNAQNTVSKDVFRSIIEVIKQPIKTRSA